MKGLGHRHDDPIPKFRAVSKDLIFTLRNTVIFLIGRREAQELLPTSQSCSRSLGQPQTTASNAVVIVTAGIGSTHGGAEQTSDGRYGYKSQHHQKPKMPSFTAIAGLFLLAVSALASPLATRELEKRSYCLNDDDAQLIANNYGTLIAAYSPALADQVLSPDFTDYSESVNTLINECPQGDAAKSLPLLAPTFTNRTAFEAGQGQQAPINFQQLNIWHSCDTVMIRWMTTNTAPIPSPRPVVGMITMETCPAADGAPFPYLIDTVYSEFDAGAWLANIEEAGFCNTATAATTSSAAAALPAGATAAA
nr:hypothetical protein CFP56_71025 [Quercus suber]